MANKRKSVWCYLNGKKHCDVLKWALAANVSLTEAKTRLAAQYTDFAVEFRTK